MKLASAFLSTPAAQVTECFDDQASEKGRRICLMQTAAKRFEQGLQRGVSLERYATQRPSGRVVWSISCLARSGASFEGVGSYHGFKIPVRLKAASFAAKQEPLS